MRHGYTVIELVVVMALMGMLLAVAVPPAVRWRDATAVRSARDELAAGLTWARVAAATHGGAALVLDPVTGRIWTRAEGRDDSPVDLATRYGVQLDPGTTRPVVFYYDGLGIGRLSNRTVRIRRGSAEVGITVSAYGRYRRW